MSNLKPAANGNRNEAGDVQLTFIPDQDEKVSVDKKVTDEVNEKEVSTSDVEALEFDDDGRPILESGWHNMQLIWRAY